MAPFHSAHPGIPARSRHARARTTPVGLLFAGGDGLTIANPIDPVLQRFNVTIDGAPPTDSPPSAPTGLSRTRRCGQRRVSPGRRRPSTAARRSPTTRCTAPRAPAVETFLAKRRRFDDVRRLGPSANGTTYYYKVSAENANGESPLSSEASDDADRPRLADRAAADRRQLRSRQREPALGCGPLDERHQRHGETGLYTTSNTLACSKTHDLHGLAQQRPVRARRRGVGDGSRRSPGRTTRSVCYARDCKQVGTSTYDGYMLRTNQLAGHRPGLPRARRQRRDHHSARPSTRSSRRATSCSCASRARRSRPGATTARPGRASASCTDTTYAARRLRRRRHPRHERARRRLRRAQPEPEPAGCPHGALRTRRRGQRRVSPGPRRPSTAARRSPTTRCIAATSAGHRGVPRERRRPSTSFADSECRERNDLLLQGVRGERQRRGRALERGVRDADRRSSCRSSRCHDRRRFNRPNENPLSDAGRWTNGVNG